ncbi:MAG: hypothetical protein WCK35_08925 [Chloroflexota bacterium]
MFKKYLHIWITFTSIASFFFGWAFLAQADRKAAALEAQATRAQVALIFPPIPTLENIVEANLSGSGTGQTYRINPATPTPVPQIQAPRVTVVRKIRTGGS